MLKAAKMFVEWLKWRAELYIPDFLVQDELQQRNFFLQGLSINGYPVGILKTSKHFISKVQLLFKKFVVHLLDKAIARGREIGNEKLVAVMDFQHITSNNVDASGLITGFQFLQAYYPERLAKMYLVNMHQFFVSVWKVISYFLEKATLKKVYHVLLYILA